MAVDPLLVQSALTNLALVGLSSCVRGVPMAHEDSRFAEGRFTGLHGPAMT